MPTSDRQTDVLDDLITLRDAAALMPRRRAGRKCAVQTIYRWTTSGYRGVRLRYVQVGSTRCTTREWLREFFAAAAASTDRTPPSGQAPAETVTTAARTPAARRKAIEAAQAEADRLGI